MLKSYKFLHEPHTLTLASLWVDQQIY